MIIFSLSVLRSSIDLESYFLSFESLFCFLDDGQVKYLITFDANQTLIQNKVKIIPSVTQVNKIISDNQPLFVSSLQSIMYVMTITVNKAAKVQQSTRMITTTPVQRFQHPQHMFASFFFTFLVTPLVSGVSSLSISLSIIKNVIR